MAKASNAALQDDEDTIVRMRRRQNLESWKRIRRRVHASKGMIEYPNSPKPPVKRS